MVKGRIDTKKNLESHLWKLKNLTVDEEKGIEDNYSSISNEISSIDDEHSSNTWCIDVEEHRDDDDVMGLLKIWEEDPNSVKDNKKKQDND